LFDNIGACTEQILCSHITVAAAVEALGRQPYRHIRSFCVLSSRPRHENQEPPARREEETFPDARLVCAAPRFGAQIAAPRPSLRLRAEASPRQKHDAWY